MYAQFKMQDPEDDNLWTYSKSRSPKIEYIENNHGNKDIVCLNYFY